MKNFFLLILVLSISLNSCKRPNQTDHSYTLEEYRELGMPDYDTVWNLENYETAFYVFKTLKYWKPLTLPAKDSEKSGLLFSRMVNIENLSFLKDDSLPLHEKAQMIKWYFNLYGGLIDVYTSIQPERQYYIRELGDIDIFGVRIAQKMLDLGNEINESDDPPDVDMQSDFPLIQKMYLNILSDVLKQQQHTSMYPVQTLEHLSDSLSHSVRRNMNWFDEDASEKIKQALLTVIDSTSSRKIINDYRELIETL
ncbi:MAG: hypothetical protein E4H10_02315 [Bacteroidia bacterium]|nr:MAG: hypothetical protein E4H10_02315 [Bacteroidia bacterium]